MINLSGTNGARDTRITEILKDLGLAAKEQEVYLFLVSRNVPCKGEDLSRSLKMHKGETYRILKSLQSKGIVESTFDRPMVFIAVPFDKVLDSYVETMKEKIFDLKAQKEEIITKCKFSTPEITPVEEKFLVIKGRNKIFAKSFQMDHEAKKEILWMSTGLEEMKYDQKMVLKRGVKYRVIFDVSRKDLPKIKHLVTIPSKAGILNAETRYLDLGKTATFTVQIQDHEGALIILQPKMDETATGLWTNSKAIVYLLRILFEKSWRDAVDVNKRIYQLETDERIVRQNNN